MMRTKKLLGIFIVTSLLVACSGEDGSDGAIGPQGEQGEQGTAGAQGEQGEQGEPGSANVIYSDWLDQEFGNTPIDSPYAAYGIEAPEITNEILDTGVILVYGRRVQIDDSGVEVSYYQLPFTFYGAYQVEFRYRVNAPTEETPAEIRIQARNLHDLNLDADAVLFSSYRYVIIPGGTQTSTGKSTKNMDYSKMSYAEVAELFGLPESL